MDVRSRIWIWSLIRVTYRVRSRSVPPSLLKNTNLPCLRGNSNLWEGRVIDCLFIRLDVFVVLFRDLFVRRIDLHVDTIETYTGLVSLSST